MKAAENRINRFIFTTEDTNTESIEDICRHMNEAVSNEHVQHEIILDRTTALETAVRDASLQPGLAIVLAIGKGDERWIKVHNKHVPFEGDDKIIQRLLG